MCVCLALTVYSPALLALNNLTLSQVSLTRQLIEQTRSLSHSIVSPPDHHYVTLDETREVCIHIHVFVY